MSTSNISHIDTVLQRMNYTGLQQAYWFGEAGGSDLHTPAVFHRSYHVQSLDEVQLHAALERVVARNELLRTQFHDDGTQTVLGALPIVLHVLEQGQQAHLLDALLALLPPLAQGGAVTCALERLSDGSAMVHFALRLIAMDGKSLALFFDEVLGEYHQEAISPKVAGVYAAFVDRLAEAPATPVHASARQYWLNRLPTLPGPPQLPLAKSSGQARRACFKRMEAVLGGAELDHLNKAAARSGVSLSALVCTAYADTLRLWSSTDAFCLNLLVSARPSDVPGVERTIGNFSTTFPLQVEADPASFVKRAQAIQVQILQDLENIAFSGVDIARAMGATVSAPPPLPVVFASTLGLVDAKANADRFTGWHVVEESIHTPQVWLDHQAYFRQGELVLSWDVAEGVFLPGVVEAMFEAYVDHIGALTAPDADLGGALLPRMAPAVARVLEAPNRISTQAFPNKTLHGLFLDACRKAPDRIALVSDELTLTYAQLLGQSKAVAAQLVGQGVGPNKLVGVIAHKGWKQTVALMGVLLAGGAYLPISPDLPAARRDHLANKPGVTAVLLDDDLDAPATSLPDSAVLRIADCLMQARPTQDEPLYQQSPSDLAYVIFTSGSTGDPKGVAITHKGAVNTILDINRRFDVTASDRVLALSAFNFDLSVFDVFGTLAVGAAIVLPAHTDSPDPEQWAQCVRAHGVTVWNSVPAYLDMLLEYLPAARAMQDLSTIRLVMLSGDWIPLDLPRRLHGTAPHAKLVSLGGATEASIWSNYYEVKEVDADWVSIPYGWPLSNQRMWVLNRHLELCPPHVTGDIFIGGVGLARGYYLDDKKTRSSFFVHPRTGERLYRTGDMGRYDASGCIEFLGRKDAQVKVRGFRIELGEIESVIERVAGVRRAAVVVRDAGSPQARLIAAYATQDKAVLDSAQLAASCAERLPVYMVPSHFMQMDDIPVTANGKLDRKTLLAMSESLSEASDRTTGQSARTETETALQSIWESVLGRSVPGVRHGFFDVGGTSLTAVRLLNLIKKQFGRQVPLSSLFSHDTIAAQAAYLDVLPEGQGLEERRHPRVLIRDGQAAHKGLILLVHPVGGNVLCYRNLLAALPAGPRVIGIQSQGDGKARSLSGMVGAYIEAIWEDIQAAGEIQVAGWSMGGVLAHELVCQLERRGVPVRQLLLIDSWVGDAEAITPLDERVLRHGFEFDLSRSRSLTDDEHDVDAVLALDDTLFGEYKENYKALVRHTPSRSQVPALHYRASQMEYFPCLKPFGEEADGWIERYVPHDHFSIMGPSMAQLVAIDLSTPAVAVHSAAS